MGIYTGPAPFPPPPSVEELIWRHCVAEACREMACWASGQDYLWRPFRLDPLDLVAPLDFFEVVR
jgi:hypothetical protein